MRPDAGAHRDGWRIDHAGRKRHAACANGLQRAAAFELDAGGAARRLAQERAAQYAAHADVAGITAARNQVILDTSVSRRPQTQGLTNP